MDDELLAALERETSGWPGVSEDPDETRVFLYRFGRRTTRGSREPQTFVGELKTFYPMLSG